MTRSLRADIGVMISASHNAFQDNGIKLFGADGCKLDDTIEKAIEEKLASGMEEALALPADLGKAARLDDVLGRYAESVKRSLPRSEDLSGLKVVVDCANGAAYKVAPQTLWELRLMLSLSGWSRTGAISMMDTARRRRRIYKRPCWSIMRMSGLRWTGMATG